MRPRTQASVSRGGPRRSRPRGPRVDRVPHREPGDPRRRWEAELRFTASRRDDTPCPTRLHEELNSSSPAASVHPRSAMCAEDPPIISHRGAPGRHGAGRAALIDQADGDAHAGACIRQWPHARHATRPLRRSVPERGRVNRWAAVRDAKVGHGCGAAASQVVGRGPGHDEQTSNRPVRVQWGAADPPGSLHAAEPELCSPCWTRTKTLRGDLGVVSSGW